MEDTSLPFELPRVAVVITCYNYRSYVERAIRSVLAQTYRNWDCVIVDDASTDGSAEHVRQLLQIMDDPRLRQLVRQDNGGQIAGFRDGFAAPMRLSSHFSMPMTSGCRTFSSRICRPISTRRIRPRCPAPTFFWSMATTPCSPVLSLRCANRVPGRNAMASPLAPAASFPAWRQGSPMHRSIP